MKLRGKTIHIVSNEPWGEIWYSKHNYAIALSMHNNVVFLDPPPKYSIKNLFRTPLSLIEISENLFLLKYYNVFPSNQKFAFLFWINERIISKRISRFTRKKNLSCDVFWSFDPYRFIRPQRFKPDVTLFFYADDYKTRYISKLVKNSDYILSISEAFINDFISKEKPYLVLKHSVPNSFFQLDHRHNLYQELKERIYAVFIGNIDHRLDLTQLKKIVNTFDHIEFLFVGPLKNELLSEDAKLFFGLEKPQNLILCGSYPYSELKYFIALSKICLAPMDSSVAGNSINHQKLIQYLAWGKPVLMPEFYDFIAQKHLFYIYSEEVPIFEQFSKALEETEQMGLKTERISFATDFTFEKQLLKIEELFDAYAH